MTEWFISGNPTKFDLINAFKNLGTIDWKQSTKVEKGDIVYIYVSAGYSAVKFKCRANKVDLKNREIDDSVYDHTGEFDGTYGRYMELEMLEELQGEVFGRVMMEKHGFGTPQSPVRVQPETKEYLDIVQKLQHSGEMDPDKHDGSYELVRETVRAYRNMSDLSEIDYKDLNLLYHMSIGTWRHSIDQKKKSIQASHLPGHEKDRLIQLLDEIWAKAERGEYENHEGGVSVGMFGTGFYSFRTDEQSPRSFIKACADILAMEDDEMAFYAMEPVLSADIPGMKAASASVILHCLKPMLFPIFNTNFGSDTIYNYFDLDLDKSASLKTYIANCRVVKDFRDRNFSVKNYRIFDIAARWVGKVEKRYDPVDFEAIVSYLKEYAGKRYSAPDKAPDSRDYMEKFKDAGSHARDEFTRYCDSVVSAFPNMEALSCSNWINQGMYTPTYFWIELKDKQFGEYPHSISIAINSVDPSGEEWALSARVEVRDNNCKDEDYKRHNVIIDLEEPDDDDVYYVYADVEGNYRFAEGGRQEVIDLKDAARIKKAQIIKRISKPYTSDRTTDIIVDTQRAVELLRPYYEYIFEKAGITGGDVAYWSSKEEDDPDMKTGKKLGLNTILYGPPGTGKTYYTAIYAVAICDGKSIDELKDFKAVMQRYEELKAQNRIAFTTFHQSYGYEEFIEGIKPVVNSESQNITYTIEPGIFKRFCEKASVIQEDDIEYSGKVWAFRNRAGDNGIPADYEDSLYKEGVIKIEDANDYKRQCNLINEMAAGDWVVFGRYYKINAIGVIVDDGTEEINDGIFRYQRKVDWKATGLSVDCREINRGKSFSNFAIAGSWMRIADLQKLINGEIKNDKPFVFIIDEINRGNISKVFGELITLIEETKRIGADEEMEARLPYSNESFGVPSNVYILGTMNTADRSIALMDTALRRRFDFIEMMPESKVLRRLNADKVESDEKTLDVAQMLDIINKRIEYLYDREHTIGHAFFTPLSKDPTIECLGSIFEKSIIPLLQEYFYEDYGKIQLVLGDDGKTGENKQYQFIKDTEVKSSDIFNTPPDMDLPDKKYEIQRDAFYKIDSYKMIAKGL